MEDEPVKVGTGYIGYKFKERTKVLPDAGEKMTQMWQDQGGDVAHMVAQMEFGITTLKKMLKVICKNPAERREIVNELTQKETYSSFGIHKK